MLSYYMGLESIYFETEGLQNLNIVFLVKQFMQECNMSYSYNTELQGNIILLGTLNKAKFKNCVYYQRPSVLCKVLVQSKVDVFR